MSQASIGVLLMTVEVGGGGPLIVLLRTPRRQTMRHALGTFPSFA